MTLEINPGDVLSNISTFPPNKRKEILELLHEYEDAKTREKCKDEMCNGTTKHRHQRNGRSAVCTVCQPICRTDE